MSTKLNIRPYARLLSMLGDQLIKNEQIAVLELIKNSYDADADWVQLSFENFNEDGSASLNSKIVIEDNGEGMTKDIIEMSWMNPATPNKFSENGIVRYTKSKKRVVQGKKGIGRYAMLKLGRRIKMTTCPINSLEEYSILIDLAPYGDECLGEANGKRLFLDELSFDLQVSLRKEFCARTVSVGSHVFQGETNTHGTKIEISDLRGKWTKKKMESVSQSFVQFGDYFGDFIKSQKVQDFFIGVNCNGETFFDKGKGDSITLDNLLETESVFKITSGKYSSSCKTITYNLNGIPKKIDCYSSEFTGLKVFKKAFYDDELKQYKEISDFGDFSFDFYIFDFNAKQPSKYALVPEAKEILKKHRVYLLRDDVRVMPYGEPTDDWLQIDMGRGTISAGAFFSNDQLVGRIQISKNNNPHLKDKTNREGLIEEDNYTSDFINIIRSFLSYLRIGVYKRYLDENKKKGILDKTNKKEVDRELGKLKEYFKDDKQATKLISQLEKEYKIEHQYLEGRAQKTESLAAVGLSVETSSHDIMLMMNKGLSQLQTLVSDSMSDNVDKSRMSDELQKLFGIFSFVKSQLKDMQLLFTSSKQRKRQLRVSDFIKKVLAIYKRTLKDNDIDVNINEIGSPLMAKCTDADILQLLINLLDNSVYWLIADRLSDRKIEITLDGNRCVMIFSDNGPGIKDEDVPYVFEAFYSGKGEDGRGLGLYISQKLMERNDYSIELADSNADKILRGANFVVSFIKQEKNG